MLGLRAPRAPRLVKAAAAAAILLSAGLSGVDLDRALGAPSLTPASFASAPVAVGANHVCALPGDGTVLCWGDNTLGQLGSGRVTDPTAPAGDVFVQQVVVADAAGVANGDCVDITDDGFIIRCHGGASLGGVTAIAAGFSHTCALLEDTTVACWGSNATIDGGLFGASLSGGELGDGTLVMRPVPAAVVAGPGSTTPLTGVRALTAAAGYTCALMLDGGATCWGNAPQATTTAPVRVLAADGTPLTGITAISAGDRNACAVLEGGRVVCWGQGLLGDQRSATPRDGTLPVQVTEAGDARPALEGITALALGHGVFNGPNGFAMGHSCALTNGGEVRCWGTNDVSQLGNGENFVTGGFDVERDYAAPVIAAPGATAALRNVTAIAAGGYFTCALVDGGVRCWGLDFGGDSFEGAGGPVPLELAAGATAAGPGPGHVILAGFGPSSVQTAAAPIADVVAIAAGGSICAVRSDGSLWCSDIENGMTAVEGLAVVAAAPVPTPTPAATSAPAQSPGPAASGGTAGPEAVIGDWDSGRIRISYADGVYTATNIADRAVQGSSCTLRAGEVIATFSGSGGAYQGQELAWSDLTACTPTMVTATYSLDGDSLTRLYPSGVSLVWTRSSAPVLQAQPETFRDSIPGPGEINLSPEVVLQTLAFTGGLLLLVPFPGALFNSTLEGNYAEIMGWAGRARRRGRALLSAPWRLLRRRPGAPPGPAATPEATPTATATAIPMATTATTPAASATATASPGPEAGGTTAEPALDRPRTFWWTRLGIGVFILLTVLLSGFLDPSFGLNAPSIATFAGMLIGLVVLLLAFDLPLAVFYRRSDIGFWLHALPATAAVSIACVLISRLTDFHPGYLYGLIIATATARKVDTQTEGRLMAAGVASSVVAAVVAWFGLGVVGPMAAATDDPGPALIIVQTALSMVVAAGVELTAFGMLPITFLVGKTIFAWNRLVWAGLFGFGWIAFMIVILNPQNGYLSDTTRTPLVTVVALLAFFGSASVLFWLYFRRRRKAVPAGAA